MVGLIWVDLAGGQILLLTIESFTGCTVNVVVDRYIIVMLFFYLVSTVFSICVCTGMFGVCVYIYICMQMLPTTRDSSYPQNGYPHSCPIWKIILDRIHGLQLVQY